MRKRTYVISALVLAGEYLLLRYPLFSLHGMREWPAVLFVLCLLALFAALLLKSPRTAVFSPISYGLGFLAGYLFRTFGTDPGGGTTNDLWIKWTVVMVCFLSASFLTEILSRRKTR